MSRRDGGASRKRDTGGRVLGPARPAARPPTTPGGGHRAKRPRGRCRALGNGPATRNPRPDTPRRRARRPNPAGAPSDRTRRRTAERAVAAPRAVGVPAVHPGVAPGVGAAHVSSADGTGSPPARLATSTPIPTLTSSTTAMNAPLVRSTGLAPFLAQGQGHRGPGARRRSYRPVGSGRPRRRGAAPLSQRTFSKERRRRVHGSVASSLGHLGAPIPSTAARRPPRRGSSSTFDAVDGRKPPRGEGQAVQKGRDPAEGRATRWRRRWRPGPTVASSCAVWRAAPWRGCSPWSAASPRPTPTTMTTTAAAATSLAPSPSATSRGRRRRRP